MAKALNLAAQRGPEKRAILGTIFLRITNDPIDAGDTRFGTAIDAPAPQSTRRRRRIAVRLR
ncbi:hypothetical protein [Burkholderia vietnamiensis]|uniref:hypothetical protein n=1 Tax=Burkholderia vietnamiensis TaxID=60552 RepID=UPI001B90C2FC|nr:hypothetical protein [Burkholderia vietnamiensis]MBR8202204.1 hypothetical protein [Burkholderia vietnamiensis]MCA8015530.1 hypothetical protein [Burkholderia vietnamiensis]MCA8391182.1 hypothetical protein [Burkholderia vietnamiensis]HDR8937163.1 hypothetical protein [Burkholderia vietnamiensis]HDR8956868.1 hypothetical protein [Burkholderia vietnamiensis]